MGIFWGVKNMSTLICSMGRNLMVVDGVGGAAIFFLPPPPPPPPHRTRSPYIVISILFNIKPTFIIPLIIYTISYFIA